MAGKKAKRIRRQNGQWVHSKASVSLAPAPWDHGAAGAANRIGLVIEDRGDMDPKSGKVVNPNRVTGARRVDMLEIYHKRGWITTRGYGAGLKLREAWLQTEMGQASPFAREAVDSSLKLDETIAVMVDRISKLKAEKRFIQSGDEEVLCVVACEGNPIGAINAYKFLMHEVGVMHLSDALERMADAMEGLGVSAKA